MEGRGIRRDARVKRRGDGTGEHEPGPGTRELGHPLGLGAGANDAVAQVAPRSEQGRRRDCARDAAVEPRVEHADELRVALCEVRVRDAAAAREQVERERHRLHVRVLLHAREVGGAVAGGLLEALDDGLALELVVDQRALAGRAGGAGSACDERDRVLHRELRARADREVRGVGGVAEQHDVAAVPALVAYEQEARPQRAVAHEPVALQLLGEQRLAGPQRLGLVHRVEAQPRATCARGTRRSTCSCARRTGRRGPGRARASVALKMKVKASSTRSVPNQTYLQPCGATRSPKSAAYVLRTRLFTPSAPTTRSASGSATSVTSVLEAQLGAELARAQLEDVQEQLARDGREGVAARAQQPARDGGCRSRASARTCR